MASLGSIRSMQSLLQLQELQNHYLLALIAIPCNFRQENEIQIWDIAGGLNPGVSVSD